MRSLLAGLDSSRSRKEDTVANIEYANVKYDSSKREIAYDQGDNHVHWPLRDFMTHLKAQGVSADDVLPIFRQDGSSQREGSKTKG